MKTNSDRLIEIYLEHQAIVAELMMHTAGEGNFVNNLLYEIQLEEDC